MQEKEAFGEEKKSTTKIKPTKKTSTDVDRKGKDVVIRGLQQREKVKREIRVAGDEAR
ncbi:hypothetical protein U1Q18_029511 [Sarracenia purpurea var. burkii]